MRFEIEKTRIVIHDSKQRVAAVMYNPLPSDVNHAKIANAIVEMSLLQ